MSWEVGHYRIKQSIILEERQLLSPNDFIRWQTTQGFGHTIYGWVGATKALNRNET